MPRPRKGPRVLAKGNGFILRFHDENGCVRERRLAARSYAEAKRQEAAFILSGEAQPRGSGPVSPDCYPVSTALARYATEHGINTESPGRIASAIDRMAGFWAVRMVDDIRPSLCKQYLSERRKEKDLRFKDQSDAKLISQSTVRRELSILRSAVNHAWKEGRISRAPYVWVPAETKGKDRWLTRDEVARLLKAAKPHPHLQRFILLALYTAARKTAILTLKWEQIDLKTGLIDFNPQGRQATSKGRARIIAPKSLLWFLKKWNLRSSGEFVVNEDGGPITDIKHSFKTATDSKRASLDGVTPHTLRHTSATWMRRAGVSIELIAQYLGQSIERTAEIYAHHSPQWTVEAASALRSKPVSVAVSVAAKKQKGSKKAA